MKKTTILVAVFSGILLSSCNFSKKKTQDEPVKEIEKTEKKTMLGEPKTLQVEVLENYFLKNDVSLPEAINYFVISDSTTFNSKIGVAKTMNNAIKTIDFNTSSVGAIALKPTNKETTITISSVKHIGTGIKVEYDVVTGAETSYTTTPVALVKLPNNDAIHSVSFQTNGKIEKTINLK